MIKARNWILIFWLMSVVILAWISSMTIKIDPFFHYHKPIEGYYYLLNNQRSQSDGIEKHFDYQGMIIGTSMTECFKTSEAEKLFGLDFIKVPMSGASYKEVNENVSTSIKNNDGLKVVIRGLDMNSFTLEKDRMRDELGTYPIYLYNSNPFDDVNYLLNRDVVFGRIYPMEQERLNGGESGITSFDDYSMWGDTLEYGKNVFCPDDLILKTSLTSKENGLTKEQKATVIENVHQNITSLAKANPKIQFYYFFTPYSVLFWINHIEEGTFYKQIEAERIVIEEILKVDNIKLFSYNNRTDITTDLNNYKDALHYGRWINSFLLKKMSSGEGLLTEDNYEGYLRAEEEFYSCFNCEEHFSTQEDYRNNLYAAALLAKETYGVIPKHLSIVDEENNGNYKISVDLTEYRYLVFSGKEHDGLQPSVKIYQNGTEVAGLSNPADILSTEWQQYLIDISQIIGEAEIVFNGCVESNDTEKAFIQYCYRDMVLY